MPLSLLFVGLVTTLNLGLMSQPPFYRHMWEALVIKLYQMLYLDTKRIVILPYTKFTVDHVHTILEKTYPKLNADAQLVIEKFLGNKISEVIEQTGKYHDNKLVAICEWADKRANNKDIFTWRIKRGDKIETFLAAKGTDFDCERKLDIFRRQLERFNTNFGSDLTELSNPGQSGSQVLKSANNQFFVKSVERFTELPMLTEVIKKLTKIWADGYPTLLPNFLGTFEIYSPTLNKRKTMMVMPNILPQRELKIFDLKGSTAWRRANETERAKVTPVWKDLDFRREFPNGIAIEAKYFDLLISIVERDSQLLSSLDISDYSLLVGIHSCLSDEQCERLAHTIGGIPAKSGSSNVLLFMGIIDVLQKYDVKQDANKKAAKWLGWFRKIEINDIKPAEYASRFKNTLLSTAESRHKIFFRIPSNSELATSNCSEESEFFGSRELSQAAHLPEFENVPVEVENYHRLVREALMYLVVMFLLVMIPYCLLHMIPVTKSDSDPDESCGPSEHYCML